MFSTKPFGVLLVALLFLAAGTGCNENDTSDSVYIPYNGPLVKTKTLTINGSPHITTYMYDSIGRVVSYSDENFNNYFEYTEQAVLVKTFETGNTGSTPDVSLTYSLNSQGLAENNNNVVHYTYDAARHMVKEVNTATSTPVSVTYTYSNGNKIADDFSNGTTNTYQYDTTKTNTIGRHNMGSGWLGTSSTNLVTSMQQTNNGTTTTTTYTYEFDSQNRVTRVIPSGTQPVQQYTYY
ncbi:MAG TPA: hypothetical protein VK154_15250 [Chitinophagales bacterium]|nr:hypothetical protein [Chitinophagales bacterium]